MKASTNLEVNLMSTLSGNVRKLLDQSEAWQRQESIKHDQNLIMESLIMNTPTKFEVNVMSGLDGNVWKLLKQAEAREGREFGGNCVGNLPKCDAKKNTWTARQCHSYVPPLILLAANKNMSMSYVIFKCPQVPYSVISLAGINVDHVSLIHWPLGGLREILEK